MQIQRIQTLMLLIAAIITGIFCFVPFATVEAAAAADSATFVFAKDAPALLVLNITIALLLIILIFMYKNLRLQMRMTILSIVLLCASIVTGLFYIYVGFEGAEPILLGGISLLVLAVLFAILALRGMRKDHKTLTSYDRLR